MTTMAERNITGKDITIGLRPIEPADADRCARIVYEAFGGIHDHHRFQRDFPSLQAAEQLIGAFIEHPSIGASSPSATARSSDPTSLTSAARSADSGRSPSTSRRRGAGLVAD